jgi:peptidoglycan hydrolase-like protein with peptidoglycan-binding domain
MLRGLLFAVLILLAADPALAAKKKKAANEPQKAEEQTQAPIAKSGDEHRQFVKTVQEMLAKAGYMPPKEADGKLGTKTREAIKRFQKDNGLKDDGSLTVETFERLGARTQN